MPTSKKRKSKTGKKRKPTNDVKHTLTAVKRKALGIRRNKGSHIIKSFTPEHKVSALLGEFAKDLLETSVSFDDYVEKVDLAAMAWTIGNLQEEAREEYIQKIIEHYEDKEMIEKIVRELIQKKLEHYDEYKYFIKDTEVTFKDNGKVNITVNSVLLE